MTNKRFYYDFEDCTGHKMIDFELDKEYPLETIGDFRVIENLLNQFVEENEELKFKNRQLKGRLMEYEEQIKR